MASPMAACKSQRLEVCYKGRTWSICSAREMKIARDAAREYILCEASHAKESLTREELDARVKDWEENKSPHATLESVLARMTPAEVKAWQDNYRFAPIRKPWSS